MFDEVTSMTVLRELSEGQEIDNVDLAELLWSCDKLTKEWSLLLGELCFMSTLLEVFVAGLDEGTLEFQHKSMNNSLKQHR